MSPSVCLFLGLLASPQVADDDFARGVQGEYLAELPEFPTRPRIGAQLIALGDDAFRLVLIPGGLPGAGGDYARHEAFEGRRAGEKVEFAAARGTILWSDGVLSCPVREGAESLRFERVERVSPTGAKPPEGAVVLFGGPEQNQFVENDGRPAQVDEEGFLKQGATSRVEHGDALIHVEFRSPFEPRDRGQARGNAGVYLQGRYEVQILDSFGLSGEHNECGGIYSLRRPDANLCLPPGAWQTYDIEFRGAQVDEAGKMLAPARITVRHNGVLVHHEVPVEKTTTASPTKLGIGPGPLFLQDHGDEVRFRNVWIVPR